MCVYYYIVVLLCCAVAFPAVIYSYVKTFDEVTCGPSPNIDVHHFVAEISAIAVEHLSDMVICRHRTAQRAQYGGWMVGGTEVVAIQATLPGQR